THSRLVQVIEKRISNRFKDDSAKLKEMTPDFSLTAYEVVESAAIEPDQAFAGTSYTSVKSYYKNNKSLLEKNEKEKLRNALQALMEPDALKYLDREKVKISHWADNWIEQEAEGLRQHMLRQAIDQIESERIVLQQQEILAQWKDLFSNLVA